MTNLSLILFIMMSCERYIYSDTYTIIDVGFAGILLDIIITEGEEKGGRGSSCPPTF